jgi:hypothetical protein
LLFGRQAFANFELAAFDRFYNGFLQGFDQIGTADY